MAGELFSAGSFCVSCGAHPATAVHLTRITGLIVWLSWQTTTGPYCRTCGVATFRDFQSHTLLAGWWGIFSFPASIVATIRNGFHRRKLDRLGAPQDHAPARALDPGKPVLRRAKALAGIALLIAMAVLLVVDAGRADPPKSADELVGRCVLIGDDLKVTRTVDCDQPNNGYATAIVPSPESCPTATESYVEFRAVSGDVVDGIVCIDEGLP